MKDLNDYVTLTKMAVMTNTNCGDIDYREEDLRKLYKMHGLNEKESNKCIRISIKRGFIHREDDKIKLGRE
jgi:hypothetical protein